MGYHQQLDEMRPLAEREEQVFIRTYKRLPLEIDYAEGMYIHTRDGGKYLDYLGGIAVNAAGHSHPAILAAVSEQIHRYMHVSNLFYQDVQIEFAERLTQLSGYDRLFLGNSGTEVNEGALKLVRTWGGANNRRNVISFEGGFHGRTYGALSMMDKPKYKEGMGPFLSDIITIPYNDPDRLREVVDNQTAAIFMEFIQGEGGIRSASQGFVDTIMELKEEFGFLLVADEIQAGLGRTGQFFSFDSYSTATGTRVRPEIVTTAKVLGAGLPLGAILTTDEVAALWNPGKHGTTFGGNAVACAAGLALLELLGNGLMKRAATAGEKLKERLQELQQEFPENILEIRGRGCILGVAMDRPVDSVVSALLERHIIANATNETVLRLLPPYIVGDEEIDLLISALRSLLQQPVEKPE